MNWWQENLFDSTQKIICCFQSNKKKNFIKNFYRDEKKISSQKKNKNIFFISKNNFWNHFSEKNQKNHENHDFRENTKFGVFLSILTPPQFLTNLTSDTPTLTNSGVWWHNLCADLEFLGGGWIWGVKIKYKGVSAGVNTKHLMLGGQIWPTL